MYKVHLEYYADGNLNKRLGVLRIWGASPPVILSNDNPFDNEKPKPLARKNKDWLEVYEALKKVYGKRRRHSRNIKSAKRSTPR